MDKACKPGIWPPASCGGRALRFPNPLPLSPLVTPVVLSRNGRWLAACGYRGLKIVRLYDLESRGQHCVEIPLTQPVAVEFSPNGQLLAIAASEDVRFWDIAAGHVLGDDAQASRPHLVGPLVARWPRLLTGSWDQTAVLWDVQTGQSVAKFHHAERVVGAVFSPDGHLIATTDDTMLPRLWDADTGEPLGEPLTKPSAASLAPETPLFNPTGRWLYVAGEPAQLWPVPRPVELDSKRLREWAEVLTGLRLDASNSVRAWMLTNGACGGHGWRGWGSRSRGCSETTAVS